MDVARRKRRPGVAKAAALGLGGAQASARSAGDPLAEEVFVRLKAELAGARDEAALRTSLLALGNSGDPRVPDVVAPYLSSGQPEIRAAAAEALRLVPSDLAGERLSALLASDDPNIQRGALAALRDRPLGSLLPALTTLLERAQSPAIRVEAVSLIGARAADVPDAPALLARVAASDADAQVRAVAQALSERAIALARR